MVKIFSHYVSKLMSSLLLIEMLVFVSSTYGAHTYFFWNGWTSTNKGEMLLSSATAYALMMTLSFAAFGLYQIEGEPKMNAIIAKLLPAGLVGFGMTTVFLSLATHVTVPVEIIGLAAVASTFAALIVRVVIFHAFSMSFHESKVIFVGEGAIAKECSHLAEQSPFPQKYKVVGFVPLKREQSQIPSHRLLLDDLSLAALAKMHNVSEIIVSTQDRRGSSFPLEQLLECKLKGIKVTGASEFFERVARQIKVEFLYPSWLIFGDGFNQSIWRSFCKRTFDLSASLLIFAVTLPIMLLTALFIFLEDRGPLIYRQERVGKGGRTFYVLKFRSMGVDAEKNGAPQWATTNDNRVTTVGKVIRKLRIDELPQVINVLKGEMSFVGPRPERPYFVKQLCEQLPYYDMRHSIKPGITGYAQVRYQYGASVDDAMHKLKYDLYYVKNHSLFLDLLILIDTLQVVLFAKGSR